MDIDWSKAPEGTTHAVLSSNNERTLWRKSVINKIFAWDENQGTWFVLGDRQVLHDQHNYIERPGCSMTVERLIKLSKESGFEVDIHPNGKLYVWDDEMDAHATGTLEEIIELCEAKKVWLKVWTEFTWS